MSFIAIMYKIYILYGGYSKLDKKIGFWTSIKNMFVGIVRPEAYIINGRYGGFAPAVAVTLVFSVMLYFATFFAPYNLLFGGGKLAERLDNSFDDFVLTDEGFSYDERYEGHDKENLTYILVDTSADAETIDAIAKENIYTTICVVSSQYISVYRSGRISQIKWKDVYGVLNEAYGNTAFDKKDIMDFICKWDTPVLVLAYVLEVITGIVSMFFASFILAIIGLIISSAKGIKMSLGSVLKPALYIRNIWYTVMMLLSTYVWAARRTLSTFAFLISAIYMFVAISRYYQNHPEAAAEKMIQPGTCGGQNQPDASIGIQTYQQSSAIGGYGEQSQNYKTDRDI